jgi:DNA invertase Pin-like site-specific DNA recombinase
MDLGYARVSTAGQSAEAQIDALVAAGVPADRIYTDQRSGTNRDRPGLREALKVLRPGDTLVFAKLDRLARSLSDLLDIAREVEAKGANLRSLGDPIDTTTPAGRLLFQILGAVAEMEAALIRERTQAGLAAARARGRVGGRKKALSGARLDAVRVIWRDLSIPISAIEEQFKVSRRTLFRELGPREGNQ